MSFYIFRSRVAVTLGLRVDSEWHILCESGIANLQNEPCNRGRKTKLRGNGSDEGRVSFWLRRHHTPVNLESNSS